MLPIPFMCAIVVTVVIDVVPLYALCVSVDEDMKPGHGGIIKTVRNGFMMA